MMLEFMLDEEKPVPATTFTILFRFCSVAGIEQVFVGITWFAVLAPEMVIICVLFICPALLEVFYCKSVENDAVY